GQPPDLAKVKGLLGSIEEDGLRAGQVIDSVRAMFAHRASARMRLELTEVIDETLGLLRAELTACGVTCRVSTGHVPLLVDADPMQLKHVLLNLFVNAIEALTPITDRDRVLGICCARQGLGVRLTFEDSGVGLDPSSAGRIFEPFYTTKPSGTGMGLALCRSIVE